jgi:hypothetical protein
VVAQHEPEQAADWLAGRYHPRYMDLKDVEAHAEGSLTSAPA